MPSDCEFEEKEYEYPLYAELTNGTRHIWTPGQVLEFHLGFDAALRLDRHPLWQTLKRVRPPPGVALRDLDGSGLPSVTKVEPRRMPDFRANLFLQAKRPVRLKNRTRGLGATKIGSPYWRFAVSAEQQCTLEKIAGVMKDRAAVVYAAPAFDTIDALWAAALAGSVASRSTFVEAAEVSGHEHWAYDQAGGQGYACSEPRFVRGLALEARLAKLSETARVYDRPDRAAAAASLLSLDERLRGLRDQEASARIGGFRGLMASSEAELADSLEPELMAFVRIQLLAAVANTEWFVVG